MISIRRISSYVVYVFGNVAFEVLQSQLLSDDDDGGR